MGTGISKRKKTKYGNKDKRTPGPSYMDLREALTSSQNVQDSSPSLYLRGTSMEQKIPAKRSVIQFRPPSLQPSKPRTTEDDSQEVKVVVAIDFATTFTGYAYSYVEDKDTIHMNPKWASGRSASFKIPTWVALDKYNELHASGFEAQSAYNEESESTQEATVSLYKEFKLQLMKKGSSDEVVVLKSEYEEDVPCLRVFGAAIKFLKEKIQQRFKDAGKVFRPWQICWVLTVPAIWDDAEKLFMKEAAKEAGLIHNVDDKHLLIALGTEVASLYCRTLKMNNFKGGRGEETVRLSPGTVYIVLDTGGGMIDITVHKVLEKNRISEIYRANGGPWGGSKINESFETKLRGILGEEFVKHCQKDNPSVWLDLILEFEQAKQSDAARPNSEKPLTLTIGLGLMNCYSEFTDGESLPAAINMHEDSGLKINKQGKLEVSPDNVMSMFSSVVRKTIDHMHNILQQPEISKASVIFIVGGFGQCPYLQDEVRKHFMDRDRNVLIPTEGNLCVVKGAVMFGYQPDFMSSRIARYTYAYLDRRLHNENTDGDRDTVELENGDRVVFCLTPIIRKGEIVNHTEERTVDFDVVTEEFKLPIYCSEKETVDDPEAKDVIQTGELHISLPSSKRESKVGTAEKVKVTFTLSTELKVKGTHLTSNTTTETLLQRKRKKRAKYWKGKQNPDADKENLETGVKLGTLHTGDDNGTGAAAKENLSSEIKEINRDHLTLDRNDRLGRGSYGDVLKGMLYGTAVAVKEIVIQPNKRGVYTFLITDEIKISAKLFHPSVVQFMGYTSDMKSQLKSLLLVYELIDGDNLYNITWDHDKTEEYECLSLSKRCKIFHQVSQALAYLHMNQPTIIHGDIKPANIMVTKNGIAKLCDLGLSKIKQSFTASIQTTAAARGTPVYMAPEQLLYQKSTSRKADIYSFGASVYEVIFRDQMWDLEESASGKLDEHTRLRNKVKTERIPQKLHKWNGHPFYSLVLSCIQFEYDKRPEAITIVEQLAALSEKL